MTAVVVAQLMADNDQVVPVARAHEHIPPAFMYHTVSAANVHHVSHDRQIDFDLAALILVKRGVHNDQVGPIFVLVGGSVMKQSRLAQGEPPKAPGPP